MPRKLKGKRLIEFTVDVDSEEYQALLDYAKENGVSVNRAAKDLELKILRASIGKFDVITSVMLHALQQLNLGGGGGPQSRMVREHEGQDERLDSALAAFTLSSGEEL